MTAVCVPRAQTPESTASLPEFEVVTVKIHKRGTPGNGGIPIVLPGRYRYEGINLRLLTAGAYETLGRIDVGPGYNKELDKVSFDIDAKTGLPPGTSYDTYLKVTPMLQRLLADRFKMVVHWEMRDVRSFSLVQAKGGHKLTPSEQGPVTARGGDLLAAPGGVAFVKAPIYGALIILTSLAGGPVFDQTGLSRQTFDFTLQVATPTGERVTAVQALEPLGLRLEERRGAVEYLVIDRAEMPTEN
jgi:uncharacterized protein (TIGR03435 family)